MRHFSMLALALSSRVEATEPRHTRQHWTFGDTIAARKMLYALASRSWQKFVQILIVSCATPPTKSTLEAGSTAQRMAALSAEIIGESTTMDLHRNTTTSCSLQ
jgi:hypothetical protein